MSRMDVDGFFVVLLSLFGMRRFEYDGHADVRPIGRGVFLDELNLYLDEAVTELVHANEWGGWDGRLQIVVEAPDCLGDEDAVSPSG